MGEEKKQWKKTWKKLNQKNGIVKMNIKDVHKKNRVITANANTQFNIIVVLF